MTEKEVGKVSDFFAHVVVAGVTLSGALRVGDRIHILGHTTDVEMTVDSMQIDNKDVPEAHNGQSIGIRVPERVRPGDVVYKVA
jgi:selenocysteine-specific translation elongation factor